MEGLTAYFEVLIVVSVMFAISLCGAYILFRFLESHATIQRAGYKAGGPLAGFLIILGTLLGSYYKLVQAQVQAETQAKAQAKAQELAQAQELARGWLIIGECQAPASRDEILVNMVEPETPAYILAQEERKFFLKGVHLTPQQVSAGNLPILQFYSEGFQTESVTLTRENVQIDLESKRLVILEPVRLQPALFEEAGNLAEADALPASESM